MTTADLTLPDLLSEAAKMGREQGYVLVNADMLNRAADKAGRRHPDDAGFGSDILAALQKGQTDAD